ncbi:lysosomal proton-coupled steroid conjugate and bile acid symporter SLC46A3 [Lepisosteus oculatus]|uniref:Solute carrier family 46 member 3 n=1 Tax=Lepisosteus oculatus TaxID=7918 RepID=W5MSB7_LEPOC|nr:PREDICTED: solute carrier family 46 member 3-like [Lepisosteus oculatus]
MQGLFLVEPVVGFYAFANFLAFPLLQQYVYRRLWQQVTNTSYPTGNDNTSACNPNSTNVTNHHEDVQKAASLFSLYNELFSIIPSLLVTLVLVSYSDYRGRKISILLPVIGSLIASVTYLCVSYFSLSLYLLIVSNFVSSLFGGFGTFLGGCFSYVADICDDSKKKMLRMSSMDMVLGLLSGVASVSTGYFLRSTGFNWPFFASSVFHCINILYIIFILEETVKNPYSNIQNGPTHKPLKKVVYGIYLLFASSSRKRSILLVLMILSFTFFIIANLGGVSIFILYELNVPLCWNEVLIGYGSALSTIVFLTSFAGVYCLSYCFSEAAIVFIGLLSFMAGMIMTAFAKTTLLMFLVRLPMLFAFMPAPVLRAMMSKIVSKSEQGALFACVAFLESLSASATFAVFNSIYAATVAWFSGFSFLVAGGLCVIPMILMGFVVYMGVEDGSEIKPLLAEKEAGSD